MPAPHNMARPSWMRPADPKRPATGRDVEARAHAREFARTIAGADEGMAIEEEGWTLSYADLVTLLLTLFVVMSAFAIFNGRQVVSFEDVVGEAVRPTPSSTQRTLAPAGPIARAAEQRGAILARRQELIQEVTRGVDALRVGAKVDVRMGSGAIHLDVADQALFGPASAELDGSGMRLLERLLPVLNRAGLNFSVVGHTDDLPISSDRFATNWELSAARASRVVRYFEALGIEPARMEAVGRAHTEPLQTNATKAGRAKNRRVSLTLKLGTALP